MPINLTSPSEVRRLLREHGLRPKKRLGQSFLVDANILRKIIAGAEIGPGDCVLEIGAGLGTLTQAAADVGARVVCVESDAALIPILRETIGDFTNVEIVHADFLALDLARFLGERFGERRCVVLANLPYYITSPIITALVEYRRNIARAVLMVQREVADRLTASPGDEDYSSFGIFVNYHCELEILAKVPRTVFHPTPEVDSAIIRLIPRESPPVQPKDEATFFLVVRAAFQQRRKTLLNALTKIASDKETAADILRLAGIEPSRRGETLTMEEFACVSDVFSTLI